MTAFLLTTATLFVLTHIDLRPKRGDKKVLLIALVFTLSAYGILSLSAFDVTLPSPLDPIVWLVRRLA